MAGNKEHLKTFEIWVTVEKPGYLGKTKDAKETAWNDQYGEGNWRYAWELNNSEVLDFEQVFWQVYVAGYVAYFQDHHEEALFLTNNYAYAFDKEPIARDEAFDPYHLYNKPGHPNQFHNVALNIALEWFLGMPFRGDKQIQVREGKPGTPIDLQPEGYLWSPGRIPSVRPDLIPTPVGDSWYDNTSIEGLYQNAKVIQVKGNFHKISFPYLQRS